jgi:hypothetical protein
MLYLTSDEPPTTVIQGGCADAAGSMCVAEAVQQVASGHVPAAHHAGMVSAHNLQHGLSQQELGSAVHHCCTR